jgi:hypothetical protein
MSNTPSMLAESAPTAAYILVQKTLSGQLKWTRDETFKPNYFAAHAFRAEHQGDLLRLYPRVHFEGISGSLDPQQVGHLEFIEPDGKVVWSFPPHQAVDDLLKVVERLTGDAQVVEDKLRKILQSAA